MPEGKKDVNGLPPKENCKNTTKKVIKSFKFKKKQRITESSVFRRDGSFSYKTPGLVFVVKKNNFGFLRLGMTVSKRAVAKAVCRVRLKRIFRESFRKQNSCEGSLDFILIARKGIEKLSPLDIKNFLDQQWPQIQAKLKKRKLVES